MRVIESKIMRHQLTRKHFIFFLAAILVVGIFWREAYLHRSSDNLSLVDSGPMIIDTGANNETVPAIDNLVFESVAAADSYLKDGGRGLVLVSGKRARFYPFQILVWHYAVNDEWGGEPVLVAYNPLCESAAVFKRTVFADQVLVLKNSGQVLNNVTLFVDSGDGALWSSLTGQVVSDQSRTGQTLELLPAVIMTWQNFKKDFPQGQILSRETGFTRDYSHNPYNDYATSPDILFPLSKHDASLPAKTKIFAYGEAAYSENDIMAATAIDFEEKIRFVWDENWQTVRGYRINEDETSGEEIGLYSGFWFCWAAH